MVCLLAPSFGLARASAAVENVEFKFTPFVSDPTSDQELTSVPGKARVLLNGILLAEQNRGQEKLPRRRFLGHARHQL